MRGAGDGCVLRHGGGRHGHAFDEALDVGGGLPELVVDEVLDAFRHLLEVHQEVDEIAVAGVGGDTPSRGVWLGEVAEVGQVGELASDGRRGQVHEVPAV